MRNLGFRTLLELRQNYWFWPSALTALALVLGYALPYLDARIGTQWMDAVGFLRPTQIAGARAILTTVAGATLGVAGVAFSITIVAVSFASANYGPRLIGNFMGDRLNQIVLGILVATFVYCITVLSTVHAPVDGGVDAPDGFVPQLSIMLALVLTLVSVGALIAYIHHVPESIDIMNLTARIGAELRESVIRMAEEDDARQRRRRAEGVAAWKPRPGTRPEETVVRADRAGYLQHIDLTGLEQAACELDLQITVNRAPGDFLVADEPVLTVCARDRVEAATCERIGTCFVLGDRRTDFQDVLFLSDQLVEVCIRALSPGVNDPFTAVLCLDWLRAGLTAFAREAPGQPARDDDRVRYRRVTFETMLVRSFDRVRQHVAVDRSVALHALQLLADLAIAASGRATVDVIRREMHALAEAAQERLSESLAREEVRTALKAALETVEARHALFLGERVSS